MLSPKESPKSSVSSCITRSRIAPPTKHTLAVIGAIRQPHQSPSTTNVLTADAIEPCNQVNSQPERKKTGSKLSAGVHPRRNQRVNAAETRNGARKDEIDRTVHLKPATAATLPHQTVKCRM
jgi:hypothetical protein